MSSPKLSAPLTLRELAIELGQEPRVSNLRRLRRLIVRTERVKGVTLYHCTGQRSPGYVTRAELRANMPELFLPVVDEAAELARAAMRDIKEEVATLGARVDALARVVAGLERSRGAG